MEIKIAEIYEKFENNQTKIMEELKNLTLNKNIKIYEYNEDAKDYDFIDEYNINDLFIWEEDQIVFSFGPDKWDICSIKETDLIKIEE